VELFIVQDTEITSAIYLLAQLKSPETFEPQISVDKLVKLVKTAASIVAEIFSE